MKLNDVIFNSYKDRNKDVFVYDDNHVILKTSMSIGKDYIDIFISNIDSAVNDGVNTYRIKEYRFYEDSTNFFDNSKATPLGLFLVEKVKGNKMFNGSIGLVVDDSKKDFNKVASLYIDNINKYMELLEERSNANLEIYDKLVKDYLLLKKYNLRLNDNVNNFYFDINKGFSFINLMSGTNKENDIFDIIVSAIFGYGKPFVIINSKLINDMNISNDKRYRKAFNEIKEKIVKVFLNNNLDIKVLIDKIDNIARFGNIREDNELSSYIYNEYQKKKLANK